MLDGRLAEGVWNAVVIWRELQARGYAGGISIIRDYLRPKRALRPGRACAGGSMTFRTRCTRRSELVKVPSFSAKAAAGRKMWAGVWAALRIVLALLMFCAPAAASEIEMSRPEGHPRGRFPLAVYVTPMADSTQEAAVRRAVEDWNSVFRSGLGIAAFRWSASADAAAVRVALAPRTSAKTMGETEIGADQNGVIELPVRIALFEPTTRGETPRETLLYEVAAHELGHALGLPHTTEPRSLMCCVWGGLDFKDPAVRAAYIEGRRHPDLRSVEVQLKAHYKAFWQEP